MSEIMMNRLPQPTWNRLRVNGVMLPCPESFAPAGTQFTIPMDSGILHEVDEAAFADSGLSDEIHAISAGPCHVVRIPAGVNCAEACLIRASMKDSGLRVHLTAEANSAANVVLILTGSTAETSLLRLTADVQQNARLHVAVCQLMESSGTVLQDFCAHVGDHAELTMTQLELGGHFNLVGNRVELDGKHSVYNADMGYQVNGRLDVNLVARHHGPHSTSRMDALGILGEGGVKCFRDTIDFVRGCHDAVGSETEDVLMLGEEVVNQSVPLILCDEENVDGTHGATIGRLDENTLYYLATRGIDEAEARDMISRARIRAVCELIPSAEAREAVMAFIASGEEMQDD